MDTAHVNRAARSRGACAPSATATSACCCRCTCSTLGFSALQIGIVASATLLGSGLLTLAVGVNAHRFHYRSLLLAAAVADGGTGLGFATVTHFWPLL